jgi:hypothetical protein
VVLLLDGRVVWKGSVSNADEFSDGLVKDLVKVYKASQL